MATDIVSQAESTTLSRPRINVALDAAYEVDALARAIRDTVAGAAGTQAQLTVRGMTLRMEQLASVLMSALDDELHDTADLYAKVHGSEPAEAAHV